MDAAADILSNPAAALAYDGPLEREGNTLRFIASQCGIPLDALKAALDAACPLCPSVFDDPLPFSSAHHGPYGIEYRMRPTTAQRDAMQACVYALHDKVDAFERNLRAHHWCKGMVQLRARWARGNYTVPTPKEIGGWL